jgi:O-antigen ligase
MILMVWALLLPREKRIGFREGMLAGAVLVGLGIAGVVLSRFDEDPTGGVRGEIAEYAFGQIALRPITGTGPNNYTTLAGPMTGSWIPVHNSFLLAAAELGIVGAALFFGAVSVVVGRGWSRRKHGEAAAPARAIVASVPAVLLIGLTGWGLMGTSVFALWLFTLGIHYGMATRPLEVPGLVPPSRALERSPRAPAQLEWRISA